MLKLTLAAFVTLLALQVPPSAARPTPIHPGGPAAPVVPLEDPTRPIGG
ncbi:hypothetical protein [Deinococcus multiflagellatus]|uniref:Uncharacterized protein n=1 Tax=Deinococcus multiflagellatus TaxID=1656887 RepID=A0ABW1ZQZ8_9DEIO